MPHFDIDTVLGWRGNTVRDRNGEKIGSVGDVFLDRETNQPAWLGVKTGFLGAKQSYVPLAASEMREDELIVSYDAQLVKDAPGIDPDVALTVEEEQTLHGHYAGAGTTGGADAGAPHADPRADLDGTSVNRIGNGVDGEVTMIRSEEEVRLGPIQRRPIERVRIKKVMVTEYVTEVVAVRREVVQLETEPAPTGNIESVEDLADSSGYVPREGTKEFHRPAQ